MLIRNRPDWHVPDREATPEATWLDRRAILAGMALAGLIPAAASAAPAPLKARRTIGIAGEELTPYEDVTSYNNFYEFGVDKGDPAANAGSLRPSPWTLRVGGFVNRPRTLDVDRLIAGSPLEERVYRLRCVEAWSMVIPWVGIPLRSIIDAADPQGSAKYVAFRTLNDTQQMPGLRSPVLDWPYVEGLRLDEARHPLALLAVGLYGRRLPNQNGAPIRLVVPWKYGFKSIKSIVAIDLVERRPPTSWNVSAPDEYGFFSNVNPDVDHPRWSQARERRIGEILKRKTLPFNGYASEVAGLYRGMDLKANY